MKNKVKEFIYVMNAEDCFVLSVKQQLGVINMIAALIVEVKDIVIMPILRMTNGGLDPINGCGFGFH